MSIQSTAIQFFLRRIRDKAWNGTPQEIRKNIASATKRMPSPPPDVLIEEIKISGLTAFWVDAAGSDQDKAILYLHGGGYMFGSSMSTHKDFLWRLARASSCRVLALDYRLAPEHPFPAAVEDAVTAYDWLLEKGFPPSSLAIAGDSAGGGLMFGTLLKLKDTHRRLPAAAVGLSPWTDLAITGKSVKKNAKHDAIIPGTGLDEGAEYYLQGESNRNPYASPLYGDHQGLPPTLIQVGSQEVLLDDSTRLASKMKSAGVPVVLEIWKKMPHVWQTLAFLIPEGKVAIDHIGLFLKGHMHSYSSREIL